MPRIIYGTAWSSHLYLEAVFVLIRTDIGRRRRQRSWLSKLYYKAFVELIRRDFSPCHIAQGILSRSKACQPKHYREDLVGSAVDILGTKHGIKREDLFLQTKYYCHGG